MSAGAELIERLRRRSTVEDAGGGRYLITHADDVEPAAPVLLDLPDQLVAEHVVELARSSEGGDVRAAVGLMAIHVDEELGSALASGGTLRAVGIRRSRLLRRAKWFVDREPGTAAGSPGDGTLGWRP